MEDFLFDYEYPVDFKAEIVNENDLDVLRYSIEVLHGGDPGALVKRVTEDTRNKFKVTPNIVVLSRGTLAKKFESAVKAPRFVDKRV